MKVTQDRKQQLLVSCFLLLDIYRILIGSFYSIFVPQSCPDKIPGVPQGQITTFHTCTLNDNVTDLNMLNKAAIGVNAVTALVSLIAFALEFRRERWMISHLEVDSKKADDNLIHEIEAYPKMKKSFLKKNTDYSRVFITVASLSLINMVISAILVADYYDGLKTVTTFATNTLLIGARVAKSLQIATTGKKQMKALSSYLSEPTAFNTIDPDYIKGTVELITVESTPQV
jgi:hypothetical protein